VPLSFISGQGLGEWDGDGNLAGRDHANFSLDASGETIQIYTQTFTAPSTA
jgi:hypothetical protein